MSRFDRFRALIRGEGLLGAFNVAFHRAYSARWERRLGVATAGDHLLRAEGLDRAENHDHSASSVLDLKRALALASPAPERDVFIDFGSGKGRAVLVAAGLPFRRVIGVELSPQLSAISSENLQRARPRLKCQEVKIETIGADRFEIPADANVLYFYNPFGGSVMVGVIENLQRSLLAAPRHVTIVFATPPHFERAIAGLPWVSVRATFMGLRRHVVYDCMPPSDTAPTL